MPATLFSGVTRRLFLDIFKVLAIIRRGDPILENHADKCAHQSEGDNPGWVLLNGCITST